MAEIDANTIIAGAGLLIESFAIVAALILLGPRRKLLQAETTGSQMSAVADEVEVMDKVRSALEIRLAETQRDLEKTRRKQAEDELARLEYERETTAKLEAITERNELLEQKNEDFSVQVDLLRKELATGREIHEKQIADLKAELETERNARKKLAAKLQTANEENEALRERVSDLEEVKK